MTGTLRVPNIKTPELPFSRLYRQDSFSLSYTSMILRLHALKLSLREEGFSLPEALKLRVNHHHYDFDDLVIWPYEAQCAS